MSYIQVIGARWRILIGKLCKYFLQSGHIQAAHIVNIFFGGICDARALDRVADYRNDGAAVRNRVHGNGYIQEKSACSE